MVFLIYRIWEIVFPTGMPEISDLFNEINGLSLSAGLACLLQSSWSARRHPAGVF